jgi:hypothetical protein
MEETTPCENMKAKPAEGNADGKREWTTPELVVDNVASVTESSFTSPQEDSFGSGS